MQNSLSNYFFQPTSGHHSDKQVAGPKQRNHGGELVMFVKMYLVAYFRYCDFTGCEMILLQKLLIIFLDNLPCAGVRDPIREGILPEFLCLLLFFRQVDLA